MKPSPPTVIWWLDDEQHYVKDYIEFFDIEGGFAIERFADPDRFLEHLRRDPAPPPPDLVIWDVIMPPGSLGLERTRRGLRTGEEVIAEVQRLLPGVPTLMFTNKSGPDLHRRYNAPEGRSWARQKRDLLPDDLVALVRRIIDPAPSAEGSTP